MASIKATQWVNKLSRSNVNLIETKIGTASSTPSIPQSHPRKNNHNIVTSGLSCIFVPNTIGVSNCDSSTFTHKNAKAGANAKNVNPN